MNRVIVLALIGLLGTIGIAHAQEASEGAGRVEVAAFPGGGILFMESGKHNEPDFKAYTLGGAFAANVNRWVGFEMEVVGSLSAKQSFTFRQQRMTNVKPPSTLTYSGNI